jgi:23S rRNA pseudouridine1911/1915/1917 synthase
MEKVGPGQSLLADITLHGKRLDVAAADLFSLTRAYIQKLIQSENVKLNGRPAKASQRLKAGDNLEIFIPPPAALPLKAENFAISIIYQDGDVAVVDKQAGLVVHPGAGHTSQTLVNALLYHIKDLSGIGGVLRPGIVHRLDKDTSGLLVIAKNDMAHQFLSKQFKNHSIHREYRGIVVGCPPAGQGKIDLALGRSVSDRKKISIRSRKKRTAVTHWQVLETFSGMFSVCRFVLETGRTHQIRVHMAALGHPILADATYGKSLKRLTEGYPLLESALHEIKRQALHASLLGFIHPTSKKYLEFLSPIPADIAKFIEKVRTLG